MPYGAVFCSLMPTAFAVLYLKYLCLHWYPCYVWYGSPDIPLLGLPDFLPADSCTHSKNNFDTLLIAVVRAFLFSRQHTLFTNEFTH